MQRVRVPAHASTQHNGNTQRAQEHKHKTELEVTKYYLPTTTRRGPNLHEKKREETQKIIKKPGMEVVVG